MVNLKITVIIFSLTGIAVFGSAETLLATDTSRYPAVTISTEERMRLREGEVLTWRNQSEPGQEGWVQAAIRINASAPQVWKVLTSCTNAEEIIPGLRSCRVVTQDSNSDTVEQRIKIAWYLPAFYYTFETRYHPYHRIEFNRVAGDFKELKGQWRFEADPDDRHTLAVYSVYIQPDYYAPKWIVRRILGKHLPALLSDLRRQVDRSGDDSAR